MALLGQKKS